MRTSIVAIALCLAVPVVSAGDGKKDPPSLAGKPANDSSSSKSQKAASPPSKTTPPGLAKKAELPPGLAKKFGKQRPDVAFVAFDPKRTNQAWLLIDGKWKLEKDFDKSLRGEVKASLALPTVKPPVPVPDVGVKLQVVKFD